MMVSRRAIAAARRRMQEDPRDVCELLLCLAVEEYGEDIGLRLVWWCRSVGMGASA